MKIKYFKLISINNTLQKLNTVEQSIPFPIGLKIARNAQKILDALIPVDKMQKQIIQNHSIGNADGKVNDSEITACNKDIDELLNQETDIELEKIKPSDLDGFSLPMNQIMAIFPMLETEEYEKKDGDVNG